MRVACVAGGRRFGGTRAIAALAIAITAPIAHGGQLAFVPEPNVPLATDVATDTATDVGVGPVDSGNGRDRIRNERPRRALGRSGPVSAATQPRIRIRIYDYTGIEPSLLHRAQRLAGEIFGKAGIGTKWERCRTKTDETDRNRSCSQSVGPLVVQLRLHSREMTRKMSRRGIELGYALPVSDGFGVIAGVFLDRTRETAKLLGLDTHLLLAHTIAHEIGHLLLGSNSHAKQGIMNPRWDAREIQLSRHGGLHFTEEQATRMQAQVVGRAFQVEAKASETPVRHKLRFPKS